MENSQLVDDFLSEIIETNREMDDLLFETDFVIETAESELRATIKEKTPVVSEDESSSALSIMVSDDIFKGFTNDLTFSSVIRCASSNESTEKQQTIPKDLDNLLEDFNTTLKSYNQVHHMDSNNDDLDKTLVADENIDAKSSDSNKSVQIKSLVALDTEEEHDYLYIDLVNTTLEITIAVKEETNSTPVESELKHRNHFEGCSQDFDLSQVGNDFTVIVYNFPETKIYNCIQEQELITNKEEPIICDDLNPLAVNYDINEEQNAENVLQCNSANDDSNSPCLSDHRDTSVQENIKIVEESSGYVNFSLEKVCDQAEDNQDEESPKLINSELSDKNINETTNNDMNVTFQNFMQSEFNQDSESNEIIDLTETTVTEKDILQNNNNSETALDTNKIIINKNNNVVEESKKRSGDIIETESKKIKLEAPEIRQENEINFTQAIFDPQETADHNDPKWSALKDLETNEDYFKSVRNQWHSLALPNPHKNNTTRYVPDVIAKMKPETIISSETEQLLSVNQYFQNRLQKISQEVNVLNNKLNALQLMTKAERKRINFELDQLRYLKIEMEKNQEELKHMNMFYFNDSQGWNANYLTGLELQEIQEQNQVLEFLKKFYKS